MQDHISPLDAGAEEKEHISAMPDQKQNPREASNIALDKALISSALAIGHPAFEEEYLETLGAAEQDPYAVIDEGLAEQEADTLYGLGEILDGTKDADEIEFVVQSAPGLLAAQQSREGTPEELHEASIQMNSTESEEVTADMIAKNRFHRTMHDYVSEKGFMDYAASLGESVFYIDAIKDQYDLKVGLKAANTGLPDEVIEAGITEIAHWLQTNVTEEERYNFLMAVSPIVRDAVDDNVLDYVTFMSALESGNVSGLTVEEAFEWAFGAEILVGIGRAVKASSTIKTLAKVGSAAAAYRVNQAAKASKKVRDDINVPEQELYDSTHPLADEFADQDVLAGAPNLTKEATQEFIDDTETLLESLPAKKSLLNDTIDESKLRVDINKNPQKFVNRANLTRGLDQIPAGSKLQLLEIVNETGKFGVRLRATPAAKPVRDPTPPPSQAFVEEPWTLDDLDAPGVTANQYDYRKDPEYFAKNKDIVTSVERMSPDEYIEEATGILASKGIQTADEILVQRSKDTENIDFLKDRIQSGEKTGAPYLDYKNAGQEGLHRAIAAKELGMESIPVQVIRSVEGKNAQTLPAKFNKLPESTPVDEVAEEAGGGDPVDFFVNFTYDDFGDFQSKGVSIGTFQAIATSAANVVNRFVDNIVEDTILARDQGLILLEKVKPDLKAAFEGLSKQQKQDVSDVLYAGDEWGGDVETTLSVVRGKEYTEAELIAGVETRGGMKRFEEGSKEIQSYFKVRSLMKSVERGTNYLAREEALRQGKVGVPVVPFREGTVDNLALNSETVPGKVFTETNIALLKQQLSKSAGRQDGSFPDKIYNPQSKEYLDIDSPEIRIMLEDKKSHQIAKLDHHVHSNANDTYQWVLRPKNSFEPLPAQMIKNQPGWMPRIEKTPFAYIRMLNPGKVNGITAKDILASKGGFAALNATALRTVARSNSFRSAEEFTFSNEFVQLMLKHNPSLTEDAIRNGRGKIWDVDTDVARDGAASSEFSKRNPTDARNRYLLYDITGDSMMPADKAISLAVSRANIELGQAGLTNIREEQFMRYLRKNNLLEDPGSNFQNAKLNTNLPAGERRALERYRKFLSDIQRLPTQEDIAWKSKTQEMALLMERSDFFNHGKGKKARQYLLQLGQGNPADQLRGAAFHAFLGVFNAAQLFVQASQMAVAVSLRPDLAPKVLPRAFAMRLLMNTDGSSEVARLVAKTVGVDQDEFQAALKVWNQTGLKQSVMQSADHNALLAGKSLTRGMMQRLSKGSLMFYTEGETASRLYAFNMAAEALMKRTGKKWSDMDGDDVVDLHREVQRVTFMLDRNNAARFQQGVFGVPTQFWQITTKTMENFGLMPGSRKAARFSAGEKMRILMGQSFLYGSVGIPFGAYITNNIGAALGFSPHDLSAEAKAAVGRGFTGFMQQYLLGTEAVLADRMSLMNGFETLMQNFEDEKMLHEQMFGAFGSVYGQRVMPLIKSLTLGLVQQLSPEEEDKITDITAMTIVEDLIKVASTGNNALKAYYMYELRELRNSRGNIIYRYSPTDPLPAEAAAQLLGFQPLRAQQHWDAKNRLKALSEDMGRVVEASAKNIIRFWRDYPPTHPEHADRARALQYQIWKTEQMYEDPVQRERFRKNLKNKLHDDEGAALIRSLIRNYNFEGTGAEFGVDRQDFLTSQIITNREQEQ